MGKVALNQTRGRKLPMAQVRNNQLVGVQLTFQGGTGNSQTHYVAGRDGADQLMIAALRDPRVESAMKIIPEGCIDPNGQAQSSALATYNGRTFVTYCAPVTRQDHAKV